MGLVNHITIVEGIITDAELLKKYFSKSFAYVSPNHVGLGVVHSFAYGVPVVTKRNSNHAQEFYYLKHQNNALLYEGDLSESMLKLIMERNLAQQLGVNAHTFYLKNLGIDQMSKAFSKSIEIG